MVKGSSYGQRRPPLTLILKTILDRYPDGGQILKEIIQNADDAGATTVKFLLDSREGHYGTSSLYRPELAKFQGPALYAQNDALFTQLDWDGIESLMQSNKKEDPLKVGRFGIGFNSVYHITDLPSIVSGERLAFLDPHEVYFGRNETGQSFNLNDPDPNETPPLTEYFDQFAPFEGVLDCSVSDRRYNGTLFRFPLRNGPSDLSKKSYSSNKVKMLFNSLQEEASLILLFLKNVEKICIYETDHRAKERLLFSVQIKESCRLEVRRKKKEFLQKVNKWTCGQVDKIELPLELTIEEQRPGIPPREHKWLVYNRIGAKNTRLRQLATELALLPWIGLATPLTAEDRDAMGSNGGRIFCFLPLPLDSDAKTELPVHVHGAFGLSDNRRELKWPGGERQNDDSAEWNQLLIDLVGTKAYASMLVDLIQAQMKQSGSQENKVSLIYQAWPHVQNVQFHWRRILQPMFKILAKKEILWCASGGGRWIDLQHTILDRLATSASTVSAAAKGVVKEVLIKANENLVTVPSHVLQAIDAFMKLHVPTNCDVTPPYVRDLLKRKTKGSLTVTSLSRAKKLHLLEYIVSDGQFAHLQGVALLPIANGSFTEFKHVSNHNLAVYVASTQFPRSLLPNMDGRFLDDRECYTALKCLQSIAGNNNHLAKGPSQLVKVSKEMVQDLLRRHALPQDWFGTGDYAVWYPDRNGHPPVSWLSSIWHMLRSSFPCDISSFENIPLIDTSQDGCRILVKLKRNSRVIRKNAPGCTLPDPVMQLLKKVGCLVLPEVPSYMEHSCLQQYVAHPTPAGVLQVLKAIESHRCIQLVNSCSPQEKKALRIFLAGISHSMSNEQSSLVRLLPIFDSMDGCSLIAAGNQFSYRHVAPPDLCLPLAITVPNSHQIIAIHDDNSQRLLKLLGLCPKAKTTFLMECVLPGVTSQFYSRDQVCVLMYWVLGRLQLFSSENASFNAYLQNLKFIPVGGEKLAQPADVFDPRDPLLQQLFQGEPDKFPQDTFAEHQILNQLQIVGIRDVNSLNANDVVSIARGLNNVAISQRLQRAHALLELLNRRCELLNQSVVDKRSLKTLRSILECVDCIPSRDTCPKSYPNGMAWYSNANNLFKPSEVAAFDKANLVGACMPVLDREVQPTISSSFGWAEGPPVKKVMRQLAIATTSVGGHYLYSSNFQTMLNDIYQELSSCVATDLQELQSPSFPAWVWHGNGFASPSRVAITSHCDVNVEPHLFALPKSYNAELKQFFLKCGARKTIQESDLLDVLKVVKECHEITNKSEEEVLHDLHLTVNILNWVVRKGKVLPCELRDKVLVPVGTFDKTLKLVPCSQSTFCDAAWLRKGGFETRQIISKYTMIHEKISHTTAMLLGVPPISSRVTGARPIGFQAAGPHESITTRLNNILKEYKGGVGVFKELVQNADDAGATEVKFLVDWRRHKSESLLSSGMTACHGPALVTWSNSLFTDEDFQNIQKLAGATKKDDLEKIGRFGLGFNSVYHFTDVPSFVSRNFAVFFDPCTTHLGSMMEDKSRPGIMIDFEANPDTLDAYPDQFKPYHGLFGCDTTGRNSVLTNEAFYYDGTIFRFPFRTTKSSICHEIYSRRDMESAIKSFKEAASNLLLFVQNVKTVTVLEVSEDEDPASATVLFEVKRNTVEQLPHRKLDNSSTFLKACATWSGTTPFCQWKEEKSSPQTSEIVSISNKDCFDKETKWLSSCCLGEGISRDVANSKEGKNQGLLACAGVSAQISLQNPSTSNCLYEVNRCKGEAFCFLPLSISTGLPVHVNGYFAVTSNRRGIWEEATTDYGNFRPIEVRWNESLMEDALAQAYIHLLEDMILLERRGSLQDYNFSHLWPNPNRLKSESWMPLVKGVYQLIASSDIPLVQCGTEWLCVSECIYPDVNLQSLPNSLTILREFGYKMVDLPSFARKGFCIAQRGEAIEERTMTQEKFLRDVFFPNIAAISPEWRDPVVCFVLDKCLLSRNAYSTTDTSSFYLELLSNKDNCYIPCSIDKKRLAHPTDLVSPEGACAKLFSTEDGRFPIGECYCTPERLLMLSKLGMKVNELSWDDVFERSESVVVLQQGHHQVNARERVRELVKYLKKQHRSLGEPSAEMKTKIRRIKMLPVRLTPPRGYPLRWAGINFNTPFLSANELYEDQHSLVIGSSRPILDESTETGCGKMGTEVRKLLGFASRCPLMTEVIAQLKEAISCQTLNTTCISSVVFAIYGFLQKNLDGSIYNALIDVAWILIDDTTFVKSSQVAFNWNGNGAPYLYALPDSLSRPYKSLFEMAGVRDIFPKLEFISALYRFQNDKGERALTDSELSVAKCFLNELTDVDKFTLSKEEGRVPIPDEDKVLHNANVLAINDVPWRITINSGTKFVHHDVPAKLAHDLGAEDIRTKHFGEVSRPLGIKFGQRENLTDRLKSILKAYPRDVGILKELVQNADDARATEIHFVYDPRQHETERMISKTWQELQGPALCVYNNRPFSEDDMEGIQRLGIGSKTDDPTKTGQYGIGFNAVYHVTDCPSFISNGDKLCILDPQVRYAPGASRHDPGRLIPLDESTRTDYHDSFPGYLEEFFDLKDSTMFRLPLRDEEMARKSEISKNPITSEEIEKLMTLFRMEAKEILLFLNHVRKISLSKIQDGHLVPIYDVSAELSDEDIQRREDLAIHVKSATKQNTHEVPFFSVTYPMNIREMRTSTSERWLAHQCIGIQEFGAEESVPNGRPFGLLPRVGLAAKISNELGGTKSSNTFTDTRKYKAFCFLPLPISTGLPLHVNGHFYLDSGRRHLWHDESDKGFGSNWNHFLKSQILPQAYVTLLQQARNYIPNMQQDGSFATEHCLRLGLHWYNGLFPSIDGVDSQWKELSVAFYQQVSTLEAKLFALVKRVEKPHQPLIHQCEWLSTSEGFFNNLSHGKQDIDLTKILLRVGFPLFHAPHQLFTNFKTPDAFAKQLSPNTVITFLKTFDSTETRCTIGDLPCQLQETTLGFSSDNLNVVQYCMKSPTFCKQMEGLPLLVTTDGVLRSFSQDHPVFLSSFYDLVPSSPHMFVNEALRIVLEFDKESILKSNIGVKEFDLIALESFLSEILPPCWKGRNTFVEWEPSKEGAASRKWMERLWQLVYRQRKSSNRVLDPLQAWAILPTVCNKLAPITMAKNVFDLTWSLDWSPQQHKVVNALRKLECPEVDMGVVNNHGRCENNGILKPYVAFPNNPLDVLQVLEHLMDNQDLSGRLAEKEMMVLLEFFQDGVDSLSWNYKAVIKRLPFFKSIGGELFSLYKVSDVYVVPLGLPLEESSLWMSANNCLFLAPCPKLEGLYTALGVTVQSQVQCYMKFIFPMFSMLQPGTRLSHLEYIRDVIMYRLATREEQLMLTAMTKLPFLPDTSGKLRTASSFYDPGNPVFKIMLQGDKFPQAPFKDEVWLQLLRSVGLKKDVEEDQFLLFANEVATDVTTKITKVLTKKSDVLVRYLLTHSSLQERAYLSKISRIKFVVPEKADDSLLLLHPQYSSTQQKEVEFGEFRGAVPSHYEKLVWTSAMLLPSWVVESMSEDVLQNLGVLKKPSTEQVVDQTKILSRHFSRSTDKELHEQRRRKLGKVMGTIYEFFKNSSSCSDDTTGDGSDCDDQCRMIGDKLRSIPCVLVDDGRVFVRGGQLAFEVSKELPPHLYKVPMDYGPYQHLFRRLGAMRKPSPLQYAKVLERLKDECKEEKMHGDEMRQVKDAVWGLFTTLQLLAKERSENTQVEVESSVKREGSIEDLKVLYLPSTEGKLLRSSELVSIDVIRFSRRVSKLTYSFLVNLRRECDVDFMIKENNLLPQQLRTKSLNAMVKEEMLPGCQDKLCTEATEGKCREVNQLCGVLQSPELAQGILRILRHQRKSTKLDPEVIERVESLKSKINVRCMQQLQTHLILKETNEVVPASEQGVSCFVTGDNDKKHIHIRHGAKPTQYSFILCDQVNSLIGNCIKAENKDTLIICLACESPSDISEALDGKDVTPDSEEAVKRCLETELGSEIPLEYHELLLQFADFFFRPGEIVGYEKDEEAEDDDSDPTYIYARIVRRIETHSKTEKEKKKERKRGKGKAKAKEDESILLSRYLIDIGSKQIEADVLDLYKFKRTETEDVEAEKSSEATGTSGPESKALVPYKGTGRGRSKSTKAPPKDNPKPRTLQEALKEVRKALVEICKLPEDKQRKAVRRLYLRWHPDKNPNMQEIANKVCQFIQSEYEKIKSGETSEDKFHGTSAGFNFDDFFRRWNYRARRQRSSYDNFRRHNPGYSGGFRSNFSRGASSGGFSSSSGYRTRNFTTARQWISQAQEDLKAVKYLLSARDQFYNLVCFHCHEVAEKALIAALFAVTGVAESQLNCHDLLILASDVSRLPGSPADVNSLAAKLWSYKEATRFPHKHTPVRVPAEVYTYQQAQEAFRVATEILQALERFTGIR